ncbi:SDR family NAD(P)-dependent oxidoreductase [Pseudomonas japonica]|uniref:NAD(P)-dependent dehydrogenase, short-chain alcohol dehydrogenase family n=1 Tax=Pseudomonas japonica TaxID=256466 RepID=A0A239JGX1_9PSED|nr:SDR family oxidoreductase [Pseudomonas japonica]SNT05085.1 NAD(P)-dependent dehydrogenase, short-chain alcohol dehydrogenase family [Pseudomonas japonica]
MAKAFSSSSRFSVAGKVIVITGATGALGSAAARALSAEGAKLVLVAGTRDKLIELSNELSTEDRKVLALTARPDCETTTDWIVAQAVEHFGRLDGILVASGVNDVKPAVDFPVADWQAVMDANVLGSWLMARSAARQFIKQGWGGKVILISSTRGKLGHSAGYSAYCPSKHAIDGLTRSLACEWGGQGICVNAIAPTVFRSPLTAWMFDDSERGAAARTGMLARIPLGRLGEPEDLVGAAQFLLSDASDFCTGQILYIDGGYTAG